MLCLSMCRVWLISVLLFFAWVSTAHANVYATNIRLNGAVTNLIFTTPTNVTVSYLLNQAASGGVTIQVKSGESVIRTINRPGGGAGALRGTNSVVWDGKDNSSNAVSSGTFSFEVTAVANGFGGWTQISDDANEGNFAAFIPSGIAVNCNTNSPYYGRVFIANASLDSFVFGVSAGIIKCNADGSAAADGLFSSGGWPWQTNGVSPWKLEVSEDDFLYANDWSSNGIVLRFDQAVSPGSRFTVLTNDNWPNGGQAKLSGPAITGSSTNRFIWMVDTNSAGVGVRRFDGSNGAVGTNDTGVTIVPAGVGAQLTASPYDVAVDRSNRIYAVQLVTGSGNTNYRVLRFPAYTGTPITTNDWRVGAGNDAYRGACAVAVDPTATYVAVALQGVGVDFDRTGAGVKVLSAANGNEVTTISPGDSHQHNDVAWDNAGNLYALDGFEGIWRVYSPPGANQATTVALGTIQFDIAAPPTLSDPAYAGGQFQFTLNGQANVSYIILSSTNLTSWTSVATNTSVSAVRSVSVSAPAASSFYRAQVAP